jgi:hypothetical protein
MTIKISLSEPQTKEDKDYVKDLRSHLKTGFSKERDTIYYAPINKNQVSLLVKKRMREAEVERRYKKSHEIY